jgi:DNA-binding transcriptional MerR regulator
MNIDQIPIGRFSVITRLSQKALRYYDQKTLLMPEAKDPFTGYRYYTGRQIEQGIKIKPLGNIGFSLDEIKEYLEAKKNNDHDTIEKILEARLVKAENELAEKQRLVTLLRRPKEVVKNTMSEPSIKQTLPQRVLSKREHGTYEETIGKLIMELMSIIKSPDNRRNHVRITGPFMTIYHDEGHVEEGADIEVAIPITGRISLEDQSMEVRNLARARPMMDLYLNDPNTVEPDDILTEIQMPVK